MSTNYSYGSGGVTSCKFCNEELTVEHPGKIATRVRGDTTNWWRNCDKIYKETICNKCLLEDEFYGAYWDELNDYPNEYDII